MASPRHRARKRRASDISRSRELLSHQVVQECVRQDRHVSYPFQPNILSDPSYRVNLPTQEYHRERGRVAKVDEDVGYEGRSRASRSSHPFEPVQPTFALSKSCPSRIPDSSRRRPVTDYPIYPDYSDFVLYGSDNDDQWSAWPPPTKLSGKEPEVRGHALDSIAPLSSDYTVVDADWRLDQSTYKELPPMPMTPRWPRLPTPDLAACDCTLYEFCACCTDEQDMLAEARYLARLEKEESQLADAIAHIAKATRRQPEEVMRYYSDKAVMKM